MCAQNGAKCQEGVDLLLTSNHDEPNASWIARFENGAEVFIANEEGADLWLKAISALDPQDMPASGPVLLVDARSDFDRRFIHPECLEEVGIRAQHFTERLRDPSDLLTALQPALEALAAGRRIIF